MISILGCNPQRTISNHAVDWLFSSSGAVTLTEPLAAPAACLGQRCLTKTGETLFQLLFRECSEPRKRNEVEKNARHSQKSNILVPAADAGI
jgi:hypothetical protein